MSWIAFWNRPFPDALLFQQLQDGLRGVGFDRGMAVVANVSRHDSLGTEEHGVSMSRRMEVTDRICAAGILRAPL